MLTSVMYKMLQKLSHSMKNCQSYAKNKYGIFFSETRYALSVYVGVARMNAMPCVMASFICRPSRKKSLKSFLARI